MADVQSISSEIKNLISEREKLDARIVALKGKLRTAVDEANAILGEEAPAPSRRGKAKRTSASASMKAGQKTGVRGTRRKRASAEEVQADKRDMLRFMLGKKGCNGTMLKSGWRKDYIPTLNRLRAEKLITVFGTSPRDTTYEVSEAGKKFIKEG